MNEALNMLFAGDFDAASVATMRRARGDAPAANEDCCADDRAGDDLEAWARHTFGANGFGDAPIAPWTAPSIPTALDLHRKARAMRPQAIAHFLAALAALLRRVRARYRAYRVARETYAALRSLDDRGLRDLGLDRSEIASVATEVATLRAQVSS